MKTRRIPFDINKAKSGAKVVTRAGYPVRIGFFNAKSNQYPIIAAVETNGVECPYSFTEQGRYDYDADEYEYSELDLFIEEEVEETDDYDPYKATVESIADMVERYSELQSLEELKDFYNNVRVKCQDAFDYGRVCMINLDEEPADNKPKFKVGDWVIDKQGTVHQIANVIENVTNHTYGYDVVGGGYFNENVKDIRLWDIKDAKDGDVLVCIGKYGQEIGIVKEYVKCLKTHCYVDWEGIFRLGEYMSSKEIYPATKEQCDTLFQKIKEEGYEWDSDKKELHEIGESKTRRMTNQELADWLCQCPEECREFKYKTCSTVLKVHVYYEEKANEPAEYILIRKNHGEWQEPLIEN